MKTFEGKFVPPTAAIAHSVLPIGGPGRCHVSEDGLVFEGFRADLSTRAVAITVGGGLLLWLVAWTAVGYLTDSLWDSEHGGGWVLALIATSTLLKRRWDTSRPQRYAVGWDGVKQIAKRSFRPLLIPVPGIERRGAVFFAPNDGAAAFVDAAQAARARTEVRNAAAVAL